MQQFIGMVLLLASLGAMAQDQKQKPAPAPEVSKTRVAENDASYVIGVQDVLNVNVWKEADMSATVPVRPDGKISLPLLNDVQASGRTPMQLATDITEKLRRYVSEPKVTVVVNQINSQRIYVLGEVMRAGAYPLVSEETVLQGLSNAGGFSQYANLKKIYVLRTENGKPVKFPFNYKDVVNGNKTDQNIILKAGDTIVVP